MPFSRHRERRRLPLPLGAGLLVGVMALAGAVNLWLLARAYERTAREISAVSALRHGRLLTQRIASHPLPASGDSGPEARKEFAMLVDMMRRVEPGLVYVTVSEGDLVLFHDYSEDVEAEPATRPDPDDDDGIAISHRKLSASAKVVPVVAFTKRVGGAQGAARTLQVALRKDYLERRQAESASAVAEMFWTSLAVFGVTMASCAGLLIVLAGYESRRQSQRLQAERIAFAGAMAGGIIHDFRNPLSAIQLDVQLLDKELHRESGPRADRITELTDRIKKTLARVDSLFREFLDLARPGSQPSEEMDLNSLVRECLDLVRPHFEQVRLRLDVDLAAGPLPAIGHPAAFKRAVLNILQNAEQFSPQGAAVLVRTRADGRWAVVEVADRGPGVPHRDRERIFEIFHTTRPGGTGLGLSLARSAMERCGGGIAVTDTAGGGATFVIRLPRYMGSAACRKNDGCL